MQRAPYVGTKPGQGGGAIGSVVMAAASPGTAWADLMNLTERQIYNLRRDGGLPKVPSWRKVAQPAPTFSMPATGYDGSGFYSSLASQWLAAGPDLFLQSPSSQANNGASQPTLAVQQAITLTPNLGGATSTGSVAGAAYADAPAGVSYTAGEVHYFTSGGLFSFARTWLSAATPTKYGTSAPGGSTNYNKMVSIGGTYVIFSCSASGITPKYSTNRTTWTNCSIPTLNADSGGAGNHITWMIEDPENSRILAVSYYGELLQSTDGITFTKLFTKTAAGTSQGLGEFVRTLSGKYLAVGSIATAGQYLQATSDTSGFTPVTLSISGKTFATRAYGVGITAGVAALCFGMSGGNDTQLAVSVDDLATWNYVTGVPDSSYSGNNTAIIRTAGGVIVNWGTNVSTGYPAGVCGDKIFTDVAELRSLANLLVFNQANAQMKPYIRVA